MREPLYLITGVTGATGGAAARELRKQGRRVRDELLEGRSAHEKITVRRTA